MDDLKRLSSIFHQYYSEKKNLFLKSENKFVHYTSAEAAIKIINNEEIWLRNATAMNDYLEVEYGQDTFVSFYNSNSNFKEVVNSVYANSSELIEKYFNDWRYQLKSNAYLFCLSEHTEDDNIFGRLSMWRAYARNNGVAIILKPEPFFSETDELNVFTSPVAYLNQEQLSDKLEEFLTSIRRQTDLIRLHLTKDAFVERLNWMILTMVLSIKHKGFEEENEWRLISIPNKDEDRILKKSVEIIKGVPQLVYKMPLRNNHDIKLENVELKEIIYKIIVGPSDHAYSIRAALIESLKGKGVEDADCKVSLSEIPYRE